MKNDLKYFIHVGRVLNRGVEEGGSPSQIKNVLILNFNLSFASTCFVPHSFISNKE